MASSQHARAAHAPDDLSPEDAPPSSPWRASGGQAEEFSSPLPFDKASTRLQRSTVWFTKGVSYGMDDLFSKEAVKGPCPDGVSKEAWDMQHRLKLFALALSFSYCARILELEPERLETLSSSKEFRSHLQSMAKDLGIAESPDAIMKRLQEQAVAMEKMFGASRDNRKLAQRSFDSLATLFLNQIGTKTELDRKMTGEVRRHCLAQRALFNNVPPLSDSPYYETHTPPCYYVPVTDKMGRIQVDDKGCPIFRAEQVPTFLSMVPSAFKNASAYSGNPAAFGFALAGELMDKLADRLGTLPQEGKLTAAEMARLQAASLCKGQAAHLARVWASGQARNADSLPDLERPGSSRDLPPHTPRTLPSR